MIDINRQLIPENRYAGGLSLSPSLSLAVLTVCDRSGAIGRGLGVP